MPPDPSKSPPRRGAYQPLVIATAAVVLGIVASRWLLGEWGSAVVFSAWGVGAALLVAWAALCRRPQPRHPTLAALLLLSALAAAAVSWHHSRWFLFAPHDLGRYAHQKALPICVDAVALHAPRRLPALPDDPHRPIPVGERSQLLIRVTAVRQGPQWRRATGRALVRVDGHLLGVGAGDRLRIFGQVRRPRAALNPGQFDFAKYARADRRLADLSCESPDCVTRLEQAPWYLPRRAVDALRNRGDEALWQHIGPERSGLAAAVLLGSREGLPSLASHSYLITGTIHLLVVSGLHVGILAMGLFGAMRLGLLPRRLALIAIALCVLAYAVVADARPPLMRAAVLAVLVCVALWSGRRAVAYNSLAAAALIVLALNPADLFRTGPQLSFLAVATLIWYGNRFLLPARPLDDLDRVLQQAKPRLLRGLRWLLGWAWHIMTATLAVWLVALPLVLNRFHVLAPVAVLISPVVWLLIWMSLMSGFALLLVGWIAPPLQVGLGWLCDGSLGALEATVEVAGRLPGGHLWAAGPATWWLVGFYLALAVAALAPRVLPKPTWCWAVLAAWVTLGTLPNLYRTAARDHLDVWFVAVGHGSCVVLQLPGGETVLYDAGTLGSGEQAARVIASLLWSQGITRIDAVLLSHADIDHYNAVPGLLQRFRVGRVITSGEMLLDSSDEEVAPLEKLQRCLRAARVPTASVASGDRIVVGNPPLRLEVLHPPGGGAEGSDNANSVVLLLQYDGKRLLLPGDLESPGLEQLLSTPAQQIDLLLAPHHGSRHSDPQGFAAWARPDWVVISGGDNRAAAEVVAAYRRAGAVVLHTEEAGAVHAQVRDGELSVETFR